jgi:hypothetical protein
MKLAVLFLCVAASCAPNLSSAPSRSLDGTVTNDGEPIKGAVVQLENRATLEIRSYITQQDGQYHFAGLRFDVDYQVWAQRGDRGSQDYRRSQRKTLSQFNSKASVRIDLALEHESR